MTELPDRLAQLSMCEPSAFPQHLVDALRTELELTVAAVYLRCAGASSLQRGGFSAQEPGEWSKREVDAESVPGRAIKLGRPVMSEEVDGETVLAIPLALPSLFGPREDISTGTATFGALCMVGPNIGARDRLRSSAASVATMVSTFYAVSVERGLAQLRSKITDRISYSHDINSLAHNFVALALEELSVEFASLWIVEPQSGGLRRRGALPSKHDGASAPHLRPWDGSPVQEAFQTASLVRLDGEDLDEHLHALVETASPLQNWRCVPIKLPDDVRVAGRSLPSAGVLELANQFAEDDDGSYLRRPTLLDDHLVAASTDVLSALIYQILRTQVHESDYGRLMHRARGSLMAARSHLQALESFRIEEYLPASVQDFLPKSLAFIENLEAQIERDILFAEVSLPMEKISLYGDALVRLEPFVRGMNLLGAFGSELRLEGLDVLATQHRSLPAVVANRQALNYVLRSILENSLMYCRPLDRAPPTVRVIVGVEDRHVVITIADNGAGIPSQEASLIFEDGYRGAGARALQPQGLGRGLHDSRVLMQRMRGRIALSETEVGVVFKLHLRTAAARESGAHEPFETP